MNLEQVMRAGLYKITGGCKYEWECFGPSAYMIDFSTDYGGTVCNNATVTFSRATQEIFLVEIYATMDEDKELDIAFRWINPDYEKVYLDTIVAAGMEPDEAYDDVKFTSKESEDEILEILAKAMNNEDVSSYVDSTLIELDLTRDEIFDLMMKAHERDITLNQLLNEVLEDAVERAKDVIAEHEEKTKDKEQSPKILGHFVSRGKIFEHSFNPADGSTILKDDHGEIIFKVVGANNKLYQYNTSTGLYRHIGNFSNDGEGKPWFLYVLKDQSKVYSTMTEQLAAQRYIFERHLLRTNHKL